MLNVATRSHHLSPPGASPDLPARRGGHRGRVVILPALLLAIGLFYALHQPSHQADHKVSFDGYGVSADGRTLKLFPVYVLCGATITAHVDEGPTAVRVTVRANNDSAPPGASLSACTPSVTVHLRDPFAGRTLIDGSHGNVFPTH